MVDFMHRAVSRLMSPLYERMVSVLTIVCCAGLVLLFFQALRIQLPLVESMVLADAPLYASVWNQFHALYGGEGGPSLRWRDLHPVALGVLCVFAVWIMGMGMMFLRFRGKSRRLEHQLVVRTNSLREVEQQLEREKMARQQVEENLRQTHTVSDQRMNERISQLQQVNAALSQEVAERRRAEVRKDAPRTRGTEQPVSQETSLKEMEIFSYSVSHDLRAPIRSINGFIQALLDDCGPQLDARARNYVLHVREAGHRMDKVIDGMLNLARVSRTTPNRRPVNLTELSRSVVEHYQRLEPGRHVDWVIMENVTARADAALVRVVVENLLDNSWKYTGQVQYPRIEFGVTYHYAQPVFYVRDNGAGFDMTYADKLFGVFQRLHDVKEFPGTGIGLATVRRIVQLHGGRVWAEAAVNNGATFFFTLEPGAEIS